MTDLAQYKVDLDTQRPNPNDATKVIRGDSPRTSFTKYNDVLDVLQGAIRHVGSVSPANPVPGMQWADPVTEPPTEYVRNSANTAWLLVSGPNDNRPNKQAKFLKTALPNPADWLNCTIVVTNAIGGSKLCMSDGANWNLVNTSTPVT